MSDSLRDQLLGLGFKPAPKPEKKPQTHPDKPTHGGRADKTQGHKPQQHAHNRKPHPEHKKHHSGHKPPMASTDKTHRTRVPSKQNEMDLGKAYAMRAEQEKQERIAAEQRKQEEARLRREARAKLAELLKDKALNDASAEHARHFEYGGKIKRIYVTTDQLRALNSGQLGVLQQGGRYLLVAVDVLQQAKAIFAEAVALEVDPNAHAGGDPYADPQYQVPDDLIW